MRRLTGESGVSRRWRGAVKIEFRAGRDRERYFVSSFYLDLLADVRCQRADLLHVNTPQDAASVRDEHYLYRPSCERSGSGGQSVYSIRPLDQVQHDRELVVADRRRAQFHKGPFAAVRPAPHFHQTRLVAGIEPHDLGVTRPVPTPESVQHAPDILREFGLHDPVLRLVQLHRVIHELRAVARPLIIPPDRDALVHALDADVVYHIFGPLHEFLDQYGVVRVPKHRVRAQNLPEPLLTFLHAFGDVHAVRARASAGLEHAPGALLRVVVDPQPLAEGLGRGPARAELLLDCSETRVSYRLAHGVLVPPS